MNLHTLVLQKLEKAQVTLEIDDFDRKILSKCSTGCIFVTNQMAPGLDEWIMMALMTEHSEQVKLIHPYPTSPARGLLPYVITAQRRKSAEDLLNVNFAKKVLRASKKGNSIAMSIDFSDNPLSHLGKRLLRSQILKQLRKTGLPIVPIHIQADRLPGGLLRKAIPGLPFLANNKPVRVNVRIGQPIPPADIAAFPKNRLWGKFLQAKIFSLGSPLLIQPDLFLKPSGAGKQAPLADPVDPELISSEIAALDASCKIHTRGQFDVIVAPFSALPNVMFEIARLRELTFRANGEGTGKSRDMDEYDIYYLQLVIWDREAQKIVGGYRLGRGDQIFRRFGVNGFYTSSLFKMKPGFYTFLQESIELGRSYVVPEYQKHRLPLFLLWKGILHYLLANPHYHYLYGPVSISKDYSKTSKGVIVEFVKQFFFDHKLAALVAPRKPFQVHLKSVDIKLLVESLRGEFDALEAFVENIEPDHFKVPVLFRQYLKQNAKFIAFNVDPNFSDCLDGLMMLDIRHLPASTLEALQQEK